MAPLKKGLTLKVMTMRMYDVLNLNMFWKKYLANLLYYR